MRLNKHCTLLLLIAILLIPSQDLLAKKKKQVKEPTDRELWAGCCTEWLLRYLVI